jgi:hypothetical protein
MKVFNLACEHEHRFEGWFGSAEDYDAQLASDRIECPVCASTAIRKMPTAPRLNLSGAVASDAAAASGPTVAAALADPAVSQALALKLARSIVANTEDVGDRFADEARRIHYREAPERGIRGTASPEQARELADEGIEVFSFALAALVKEPLQ